jgi:hypothetical protein
LGAEPGHSACGKLQVKFNGHIADFHVAWHTLPKQEVIQVGKFIEACGAIKSPFDVGAVLLLHACRQGAARDAS